MKANPLVRLWLSAAGLGLLVLGVIFFVVFNTPRSISAESPVVPPAPTIIATTSPAAEAPSSPLPELVVPRLDPVDYPPGSIGHACEVNEFPPRNLLFYQSFETWSRLMKNYWAALENEKCRTALERQVNSTNPYLWGKENDTSGRHRVFTFVNIENPVTFARIFTDPVGDLARVQKSLARPECQLGQDAESNWQLHETCHADAIHNYALITRFCYNEGVSDRTQEAMHHYKRKDNPTPEQDRSMWIQELEADWIQEKCKTLDPILDLQASVHTELRKQILALQVNDYEHYEWGLKSLGAPLIELAARLGDDAAGLTQGYSQGYKYGPLVKWFPYDLSDTTNLFTKHPPSVDRLRRFMALFTEHQTATDKTFVYDQEALVQHLCTPPYYTSPWVDEDTVPEPPTCRSVIDDLRQELHDNKTFLSYIATFEDVAMRLDVYE